jgi:hypothetical protein
MNALAFACDNGWARTHARANLPAHAAVAAEVSERCHRHAAQVRARRDRLRVPRDSELEILERRRVRGLGPWSTLPESKHLCHS